MQSNGPHCKACLKKFQHGDLSIKLDNFDESHDITIKEKFLDCVPEISPCDGEDELCARCNYMLGISYTFRKATLEANKKLSKSAQKEDSSLSVHFKYSNKKGSTSGSNCEFSFKSDKSKATVENNISGVFVISPSMQMFRNSSIDFSELAKVIPQNCFVKTDKGFIPLVVKKDGEDIEGNARSSKSTEEVRTRSGRSIVSKLPLPRRSSRSRKRTNSQMSQSSDSDYDYAPRLRGRLRGKGEKGYNNDDSDGDDSVSNEEMLKTKESGKNEKETGSLKIKLKAKGVDELRKEYVVSHSEKIGTTSKEANQTHRKSVPSQESKTNDNIRRENGNDQNLLEVIDDEIITLDSKDTAHLSKEDRHRVFVKKILQCNSHIRGFKPEHFECAVAVEKLPDNVSEQGKTEYLCQCNHCGITFTSKPKLLAHIKRHFQNKPFQCKICNRGYFNAHDLKIHMIAHEKNFQKSSHSIDNSVQDHPQLVEVKTEPIDDLNDGSIDSSLLVETVMGKPTPAKVSKQPFDAKLLKRQANIERPLKEFISNMQCKFCQVEFRSEQETDIHRSKHCYICFQVFHNVGAHVALHNVKDNRKVLEFYCLLCKEYKKRNHFYEHTNIPPPLCRFCGITIVNREKLHTHELGCRDYECKYCGLRFTSYTKGRTHEYHIHEKEKNAASSASLVCRKCNREFINDDELARHTVICENTELEKTYRCEICKKYFTHFELIQHMQMHIS